MSKVNANLDEPRVRLGHSKLCAVCGDTCHVNVRLLWRRSRDQKLFDVCLACAEADRVNEHSVDNYGPSPFQDLEAHDRWNNAFWEIEDEDE